MPSLYDILEIGARALFTHQSRVSVAGHNIANAATEGYTRQRAELSASRPADTVYGQYGTGVTISVIRRIRDEITDRRIRSETSALAFNDRMTGYYQQIQTAIYEPLGNVADIGGNLSTGGIAGVMDRFFSAAQQLTTQSDYGPVRTNFIEEGKTLVRSFNESASALRELNQEINTAIIKDVESINVTIGKIADLNRQVANVEVDPRQSANDLKDERDRLIEELASKVDIQVLPQEYGVLNVAILGVNVVDGPNSVQLKTFTSNSDPNGFVQLRFDQEPSRVITQVLRGGELGALIQLRDQAIPTFQSDLDTLAKSLIQEVNRIHSAGSGISGYNSIQSEEAVSSASEPLFNAGLPFEMQSGSFNIRLYDSTGQIVDTYTIAVDPNVDTLADVAARIDAADGVVGGGDLSAQVTGDNKLSMTASTGYTFRFMGDSSYSLAALGVNTFFTGANAQDMAVNFNLQQNPDYLATSQNGERGDNTTILGIAQLRDQRLMVGNNETFGEFYRSTMGRLGMEGNRFQQLTNNSDLLLNSLKDLRGSISGVSIDEEMINLIQAQQSYTAAARLVTTLDEMLDLVTNRLGIAGR